MNSKGKTSVLSRLWKLADQSIGQLTADWSSLFQLGLLSSFWGDLDGLNWEMSPGVIIEIKMISCQRGSLNMNSRSRSRSRRGNDDTRDLDLDSQQGRKERESGNWVTFGQRPCDWGKIDERSASLMAFISDASSLRWFSSRGEVFLVIHSLVRKAYDLLYDNEHLLQGEVLYICVSWCCWVMKVSLGPLSRAA